MSLNEMNMPNQDKNDEISLRELIMKIKLWWSFIVSKWMIIFIFVGIGCLVGFFIKRNSDVKYVASCTFTLDEGNNAPAQNSGLALLGLGGSAEGGIFQGKNLIWLYSSQLMIEKALLTHIDSLAGGKLFIDWFLEVDEKGKEVALQSKGIKFQPYSNNNVFSKEQSNVLGFAQDRIKSKCLVVAETKNTDNFITVTIKHSDELFAKKFSDILVATVNDYYIDSKTEKIRTEIEILQNKASLFKGDMNSSLMQTATAVDNTPYPNFNRQVAQVAPQKKRVDVEVNSTLYVEMVKNLEANKMLLAKATPLIQVIEEPRLPLGKVQLSLIKALIIGGISGALIIVFILSILRVYRNIMTIS